MAIKIANMDIGWGKDLTGLKFGRLTVISFAGRNNALGAKRKRLWNCVCDCGNKRIIIGQQLRSGQSASCGCLKNELVARRRRIHGMADKHPIYWIWQGMKTRCYNRNEKSYKNYGGRGIVIEEPWRSSFVEFSKDMLPSWKDGWSIERKDVNGNYCKSNCVWVPRHHQNKNKRNTLKIEYNGETKTLGDWCVHFGVSYPAVHTRIRRGWPKERWFMVNPD